jgi:hypothetical protein
MPYLHLLSDPGMNYTLNRPLLDGTSPARLKEVRSIVPKIKDYDSWHSSWLGLAKTAEKEKRYLDAASYYHGAEFYLPAGDVRNGLYDDFARNWALGMKGEKAYERIEVPYLGGNLPGFRLQAKGKEISTFIFNGGYDSFVEEFYNFLLPLTELGFTVNRVRRPRTRRRAAAGHLLRTCLGEGRQSSYRQLQGRFSGLARRVMRRLPVLAGGSFRAAHQARYFYADLLLRSQHDVKADDAGKSAGVDIILQGR